MKNIFYSGEKPPTNYWYYFRIKTNWLFSMYVRHDVIQTINNEMKLKKVMEKIKFNFLENKNIH